MTDKNIADVADKAVDQLVAISEALRKLAPGAWESAVRAQRVDGIVWCSLITLGWLVFAYLCVSVLRELRAHDAHDEYCRTHSKHNTPYDPPKDGDTIWGIGGMVVGAAIGLFTLVGTVSELPDAIGRVAEPEAWAAAHLIQAVK